MKIELQKESSEMVVKLTSKGIKETFAYIIAGVNIDEHKYGVRIAVKKK